MEATTLKTPDATGIKANQRYMLWAKIGGEMQLVGVMTKDKPYPVKLENGGTAMYVGVFGYGVNTSVNVKKLREIHREKGEELWD